MNAVLERRVTMREAHRRIALPEIKDPRGALMFAEQGRHIPFPVKRVFALYGIPEGSARGGHAHRAQEQFVVMLAGSCTVVVDDGEARVAESLSSPTEGLYVPAGLWLDLTAFSRDAVCLVLASGLYDEADYIRDRAEFVRVKAIDSRKGPVRAGD
jgi:dTDP-4-dehydrorhamnose 3,5-epimerase-like enzyme